jgi:hypothetical protein
MRCLCLHILAVCEHNIAGPSASVLLVGKKTDTTLLVNGKVNANANCWV